MTGAVEIAGVDQADAGIQRRDRLGRRHVADLRATAARRAGDADVLEFVARLRSVSAEFGRLWDEHRVAVRLRIPNASCTRRSA
ncbi:hypothetical protein LTT66_08320 [Nocardia gipuzkoensis]|nr:hypothetical protein [Nocardia gipuzkoensis]UGT70156.1 hypothetical protein LTT66_08320 [Nocardia gipuzkoensis]